MDPPNPFHDPHGVHERTGSRAALLGIPNHLEVQERIGSGGFGSVYAVHDRSTGRRLALKRLERVDPSSIYRFKQEFRLIQGHPHPRLIRVEDLFFEDDRYCYTMELLDAVPFGAWVRGNVDDPESFEATTTGDAIDSDQGQTRSATSSAAATGSVRSCPTFQEDRLRSALRQLVEGVLELHALGILHRDLKPSNVLVDTQGRLKILDFGIAIPVSQAAISDNRFLGTPAYMSPEQARGVQLSMASDWYSVGVMLYEALTGHLPFNGTRSDMLRARLSRDPRPPGRVRPDLPSDLCDLAMALLRRDPFERPNGFHLGARLGIRPSVAASPRHVAGGTFVGREEELAALRKAFSQATEGSSVVTHIHGESGLGKTTLVQRFVSDLVLGSRAIVLEGRCYERESVPFKAVDGLLDALSRYLSNLPEIEAASLMPRDVRALVEVFPALGRIPLTKELGGRPASNDVHELRRRAFGALRELLTRLSDTGPLVLVLEDIHWGDADSADLLRHILAPPDSPALLLIASYRDQPNRSNPLVTALIGGDETDAPCAQVDIPIAPLAPEAAQRLALALLPEDLRSVQRAEIIARESANSPFFIGELVRATRVKDSTRPDPSIQQVVRKRIEQLPPGQRDLLATLAASERSLSGRDLSRICSLSDVETADLVERLREEQLIAVDAHNDEERFSILHDKVKAAILDLLDSAESRAIHAKLGRFFESTFAAPETVANHYLQAEDEQGAFRFSEKAGDYASRRSAFHQALEKYETALELAPAEHAARLRGKLATTLGRAGLGVRAAELHLEIAARGEDDVENHTRLAGEHYLLAGLTEQAVSTLSPILKKYALLAPTSKLMTGARLLWQRRRLKSRLKKQIERPGTTRGSHASPEALEAVDVAWNLANGFAGIDVFLSVHYNSVTLSRALRAGEPGRIARALALDAILRTLEGRRGQNEAEEVLEYATYFSRSSGNTHSVGWVTGARAILALHRSDLVGCEELAREALDLLRDSAELSFREIGTLSVWFWLYPSFLLGQLRTIEEHAPSIAREAESRGDRYTLSTTRTYVLPLHHAVVDQVQAARSMADLGLQPFEEGPWLNQHWAHLHSHCFLDLYEGHGQTILQRTSAARPRMKAAFQLLIQAIRIDLHYLEGRGHLDQALHTDAPSSHLAQVQSCAAVLEREQNALADLYARTLRAGATALIRRGHGAAAFEELADAYQAQSMPLHAAAAFLRAGELSEGVRAVRLMGTGQAELTRLGAVNPLRMSWLLIPRAPHRSAEKDR